MTIGTRTNNFDIDRPPLAFGIEWSGASSDPVTALTRLGDASTLQVNTATGTTYAVHTSDFSNYYPWAGMRRVSLNHNGDYTSIHGEVDGSNTSTFNESTTGNEKIMVEIPKFWYLVQRNTPVAGAWSFWVSPYPLEGYAIHPAFVRGASGTTANILDYIYVGAYEAYVDATNAAFPSLYSVANVAPSVSKTRAQFRSYATNMGEDCTRAGPVNAFNYGLMDWQTWQAVALLYLVEYGSLNSMAPSGTSLRGGLSAGITNDAAVEKTGWTSSEDCNTHSLHSHDLGNNSGQVKCNTNGGNAVWAMSYRGIENLWGNTFTILDGININSADKRIWINYTGQDLVDQANADLAWPYIPSSYTANTAAGNPKYPTSWDSYHDDEWMFEKYTMGASTSTYMCSAYTVGGWATAGYPRMGGKYNSGAGSGIFCEDVSFVYATNDAATGARLQFIPAAGTYYRY